MGEKYRKMSSGFTLIELLVVITILTLLMLLSFLVYRHQIGKAYDSKRKSDIYDIKIALEEYEKDHNCYPDFVSCEGDSADDFQPYISMIPCDPETKKSYVYYPDPSNLSCHKWYWIFSNLSNDNDSKISDLGCTNGCGPTADEAIYNYYASSPNAPDPYFGEGNEAGPWGCFNGECKPLNGLSCTPQYGVSDCRGQCLGDDGLPAHQCE